MGWLVGLGLIATAALGQRPDWLVLACGLLVIGLHPFAWRDRDLRRAQFLSILASLAALAQALGEPDGPPLALLIMVPTTWFLFEGLAFVHGRRGEGMLEWFSELARILVPCGFWALAFGGPAFWQAAGLSLVLMGTLVTLVSHTAVSHRGAPRATTIVR
ncbi:MAG: hypothetical protein AAGD14_15505 [Planctomycetota bacterium]